jgi:hypothetical protein
MRVFLQSTLPCSADQAWAAVQTSALLEEICAPLIYFAADNGEQIPERWTSQTPNRLRPKMFGVLPLATRTLNWERIDHEKREIQTREYDAMIRRWDHRIHVEPAGDDQCRYTDDIQIQAGVLTPLVWLWAQWFYRHRRKRWRQVAQRLAQEMPKTPAGAPA